MWKYCIRNNVFNSQELLRNFSQIEILRKIKISSDAWVSDEAHQVFPSLSLPSVLTSCEVNAMKKISKFVANNCANKKKKKTRRWPGRKQINNLASPKIHKLWNFDKEIPSPSYKFSINFNLNYFLFLFLWFACCFMLSKFFISLPASRYNNRRSEVGKKSKKLSSSC